MNPTSALQPAPGAPRIIPRSDHPISRSSISPNALRVLYRLKEAGFQAFLVGGCVRDILLGLHPKDFDVATDALPEQVRRLFRNCRLVGRRFRLAHIVYGQEVIEVATFRAAGSPPPSEEPVPAREDDEDELLDDEEEGDEDEDGEGADPRAVAGEGRSLDDTMPMEALPSEPVSLDATQPLRVAEMERLASAARTSGAPENRNRVHDDHGRLLRDNIYGTIDEDVWRRDFTVNALYYNIADFSIWDYCGGLEDIGARRLRLIGDVETRYREDPVRMLRAARFEAKLGFHLDPACEEPIAQLKDLLAKVPAARLFDESSKLFLTGHGEMSLHVLRKRGLMGVLFPAVERFLAKHPGSAVERLLVQGLANTDARVADDKPVTPTFLYSLLLYGPIAAAIEKLPPQRWHEPQAILEACDHALRDAQQRVSIPRRVSLGVRDMYAMQPRLEGARGKRALRLLEQPRFRAAYDLLMLRAAQHMAPPGIAEWWHALQEVGPAEREKLAAAPPHAARVPLAEGEPEGDATAPGKRRRRRRRRRGGGGGSGGGGAASP